MGKVSSLILRTIYEQERKNLRHSNIFLFPIGQVDTPCDDQDHHFSTWLMHQVINGRENYDRDIPSFKICPLWESVNSVSKNQNVLNFYDLDSPTESERNATKLGRSFFPSKFGAEAFKKLGCRAEYLKLAFDSFNFKPSDNDRKNERIVFNIIGEFQNKRHHRKTILAWIKKYGNNPRYMLQCFIHNPAISDESNKSVRDSILKDSKQLTVFNVNFYPFANQNKQINHILNSCDIIIGLSGGESFSFPEFNSVAIGKHAILLKAHSHLDWATDEMVTWVNPSGKTPSHDGLFFQKGLPYDQGYIYDFNEEEFVSSCEIAIIKTEADRVNRFGLELQKSFSKELLVDNILRTLSLDQHRHI